MFDVSLLGSVVCVLLKASRTDIRCGLNVAMHKFSASLSRVFVCEGL